MKENLVLKKSLRFFTPAPSSSQVQGGREKSRSLPASLPFRGKLRIGKLSSKNLHMGMWYIYTLLHGHIKAAFKCTKCTALGIAEIDCMLAAADVHGCY
jgi:hypothetical protein